jgi:hypothetical protein
MMSFEKTGGPAFPSMRDMRHNPDFDQEEGMSLRDYFAAKAMQGDVSRVGYYAIGNKMNHAAMIAYAMADAMLAEREKK